MSFNQLRRIVNWSYLGARVLTTATYAIVMWQFLKLVETKLEQGFIIAACTICLAFLMHVAKRLECRLHALIDKEEIEYRELERTLRYND